MVQMSPELRAAIDVARQRIPVEGYYTKVVGQGLAGHAKGYISGSMLGMATGMLGAITCWGALALANIAIPGLSFATLALGASSLGLIAGGTVGSRVGASTGAVSAAFEERERRDKGDKLEQEILASPEKQLAVIEAYERNPVVQKSSTIAEMYSTNSFGDANRKMFDVKTILFAGLACAAVGALVCVGSLVLTGGIGWGILAATKPFEAAVIGAGLGAASGVTFGIAYPAIFGTLTQKSWDMLSGKMIRGGSNFEHVKTIPEVQQEMVYNHEHSVHPQVQSAQIPLNQIRDAAEINRLQTMQQQVAL